jgi:hypothetical protein
MEIVGIELADFCKPPPAFDLQRSAYHQDAPEDCSH